MLKNILNSLSLAIATIRTRFFHTLLSVLGIVIGVAALVAILSLIDGLERYANEQIEKTTSLTSVLVRSEAYKKVNNLRVRKDTFSIIGYEDYINLQNTLEHTSSSVVLSMRTGEVIPDDDASPFGARIIATSPIMLQGTQVFKSGRNFNEDDLRESSAVAILNEAAAAFCLSNDSSALVGRTITINKQRYTIVGIVSNHEDVAEVSVPIVGMTASDLVELPPQVVVEATTVEHVKPIQKKIYEWAKGYYGESHDIVVITNEFRVEQAAKGFLLFRIVMGLIVGISVVVGGIGVMNVLLISVNERTVEIGIRKAVGAKQSHIVWQFLSESITVSVFGSLIGLLSGIGSTMVILPVIEALTDIPLPVAYTWNTFFIISIVAVLTGIIFGTYPAVRASRLDPVEAIRREV